MNNKGFFFVPFLLIVAAVTIIVVAASQPRPVRRVHRVVVYEVVR